MDNDENLLLPDDAPPDPAITPEVFREWRSPRRGTANPERMHNPLWEWLVRSGWSASRSNAHFQGPSPFDAGPGWCFERFGRSVTELPDGRTVLIAGEHEDGYDPDFHIYNDVVVRHPDGLLEIYGYPIDVFPPTDFHSATLVGNRIVLIGCLGYSEQRTHGTTPIAVLDPKDFSISQVASTGCPPGWIYRHEAELAEGGGSILVRRGMLDPGGEERSRVENLDEWRLHLEGWRWERLTERRWGQWEVRRQDRTPNQLWRLDMALQFRAANLPSFVGLELGKSVGEAMDLVPGFAAELSRLDALCNSREPDPALDLARQLYRPPVAHETLPSRDGEYGVNRIVVDGVVVRYVQGLDSIHVTAEGELAAAKIEAILADLADKLARLENSPCEHRRL
jgi:hypothetical protein